MINDERHYNKEDKMNDNEKEMIASQDVNADDTVTEYEGMPKWKENLFKALPLIITLACVGLFALGIKWVAGIFYMPEDTLYERTDAGESYRIVHCYQNPSSTYYVYTDSFVFDETEYEDVGSQHEDAHFAHVPEVYFILNETALDARTVTFKKLCEGNGLVVFQFDEFVLYRLEGQYGVFAPLRDYGESTTSRKNDLYVIRQLMKKDRYLGYELPDGKTGEEFLEILEKLEWQLDTEYIEDQ